MKKIFLLFITGLCLLINTLGYAKLPTTNNIPNTYYVKGPALTLTLPWYFDKPCDREQILALPDKDKNAKLKPRFANTDMVMYATSKRYPLVLAAFVSPLTQEQLQDLREIKEYLLKEDYRNTEFIKVITGKLKESRPGLNVTTIDRVISDNAIYLIFACNQIVDGRLIFFDYCMTARKGYALTLACSTDVQLQRHLCRNTFDQLIKTMQYEKK